MEINITELRKNIYKLLDEVAETGIPIEIKRKGKILKIIKSEDSKKLKNLKKRDIMNCDPNDIVHIDWSDEWQSRI